jgi:hypothetical protein
MIGSDNFFKVENTLSKESTIWQERGRFDSSDSACKQKFVCYGAPNFVRKWVVRKRKYNFKTDLQ